MRLMLEDSGQQGDSSLYEYLVPFLGEKGANECCGIVGYIGN
jgi:hypothetical protein